MRLKETEYKLKEGEDKRIVKFVLRTLMETVLAESAKLIFNQAVKNNHKFKNWVPFLSSQNEKGIGERWDNRKHRKQTKKNNNVKTERLLCLGCRWNGSSIESWNGYRQLKEKFFNCKKHFEEWMINGCFCYYLLFCF